MPYTAAQLTQYFTTITGAAPGPLDATLINAAAAQNANGSQSDVNTLLSVFNSPGVQSTFEAAESVYTFFNTPVTGGGLSQAGVAFFNGYLNGTSATNIASFNTENRYYNLAISAAGAGSSANAGFVASYGTLSFAQTVQAAYETIIGSSNVGTTAANAAIADIISRQAFFTSVAQQRAGGVDAGGAAGQNIALKAVVIGYILEEANKADVGTYAKAIDQLEASVAAGNAQFGANVLTTYSQSGSGFNQGFAALGIPGNAQTNFSLTTNIDTFQPTTGGIQFVGVVNQNGTTAQFNPSTLQGGDQVRGTGGNNTLTIDTIGTVNDATGGAIVSGIQTINVRAIADPQTGAAAGATLNANFVPGATAINAFTSRGTVTLQNVGASTSVGLVGDGVTTGGSLNAGFTNTVTTANVNIAGGTTTGFVQVFGGGLTTANVNSNGGLNNLGGGLFLNSVTTLNLAATSALTVATTNAPNLTTLTASGSAPINLGPTAVGGGGPNTGTVTSVNTSALTSTGALTATFNTTATAATFTLGAGSDNLTLNGNLVTGTNLNLGGGSNSVTVNGALQGTATIIGGTGVDSITVTGALSATSVINSSGGGDTISIDTAVGAAATTVAGATVNGGGNATLVTNGANFTSISTGFSAANRALITGFSGVGITDALVNGATYDVNAIGAQNFTTVGVAAGGTATLSANTGALVTFVDNLGGFGGGTLAANNGTLNIGLASAASTTDVLTLGYTAATATSNVTTTGVETVQVVGNNGATAGTATITLNLTDAAAQTITFAGNDSFAFTAGAGFTALKTVNAASLTGAATLNVSAITTATAAAPISVTGGAAADTITVRDFAQIRGGAGADTVNANVTTSGQTYSTFLDATAGDKVFLTGATSTFTAATAPVKITLAATAVFQDFLDAATASANATGAVNSFDFGGNTYLVVNRTGGDGINTYQNGVDSVIQLVGIHAVGTATAGVVTLGS